MHAKYEVLVSEVQSYTTKFKADNKIKQTNIQR